MIKSHWAALNDLVSERTGRKWVLFVDRDGVINRRVVDDYVRNWDQFEWLPGSASALRSLKEWAPNIVVVTNQQGIGKGLMSNEDVHQIHQHLLADLGVPPAVDDFLVCPHLEALRCNCRKPKPGLVLDWLRQHADCRPELSVVVGDSLSDIALANNLSATFGTCPSIHIADASNPAVPALNPDFSFESLQDLAMSIQQVLKEQRE